MVLVAGIAVHVMPCHDCGIYSKHLCIVYHDACETILCVCMFYNAVFVYLYLYGLWPEIKSYYYIIHTRHIASSIIGRLLFNYVIQLAVRLLANAS